MLKRWPHSWETHYYYCVMKCEIGVGLVL
jgi:hypothetical protein